jgi:hypothetical protein
MVAAVAARVVAGGRNIIERSDEHGKRDQRKDRGRNAGVVEEHVA